MPDTAPVTILAIASYEKGHAFLRQARREGARVFLLTSLSLKDSNTWPRDVLADVFFMPDEHKRWNREDTIKAVSYLARTEQIDRIVPLDDFDLEMAAALREHLRIPGMGETTVRHFRDKLAMRMRAEEAGIAVPDFIHVLNHARLREFCERVPAPWVLKPRSSAGAIGIRKVEDQDQLWRILDELGDQQSHFLLERFIEGAVFHVDTIIYEREFRFAIASGYGRPPMEVAHGGGVFTTRILERGSAEERTLLDLNRRLLGALGLVRGVSHSEYILGRDGRAYFLETSARVGGAHIAELIEAATGINLWAEWARIEVAGGSIPYDTPAPRDEYGGLLVSLARQEWPDTGHYTEPEIVWRLRKQHHVGLIVVSPSHQRVGELLDLLARRASEDFGAVLPPRETPHD